MPLVLCIHTFAACIVPSVVVSYCWNSHKRTHPPRQQPPHFSTGNSRIQRDVDCLICTTTLPSLFHVLQGERGATGLAGADRLNGQDVCMLYP